MSFDYSRFSFHPWHDFLGVVMQQGRVQLDSDWNDLVAQLTRRLQVGTMDTFGQAVVPRETPEGFLITPINSPTRDLTIGVGRFYVDGLLAENHGTYLLNGGIPLVTWDTHLAELTGTQPTSYFGQPYLPFNSQNATAKIAKAFNPPIFDEGKTYLVYVDVWQREVTALQMPELIEKAVGVDTTGRLQMVWQVRALALGANSSGADCNSAKESDEWKTKTSPSGARLSTSTGGPATDSNPCIIPAASGYQGLENQLYRVEIHNGGPVGAGVTTKPTFKWSRDNATVASRVTQIPTLTQLVVEHVKRDDVLGFHGGDWIEILDDRHELHGQPGILRRIKGDGVDEESHLLTLETALPDGEFQVGADLKPKAEWNTRVRRWDQSGMVLQEDGTRYHDLNSSGESDGIPIPPKGTKLILENGILVEFSLDVESSEFKTGDFWDFAARTVDGSIEILDKSPPRGIHHHYACLAVVNFPNNNIDCRTLWPPIVTGGSCDCTVCVHADGPNEANAAIQEAIDTVRKRGGGTVCLEAGTYRIKSALHIKNMNSIRIRGQGPGTLLLGDGGGPVFEIDHCEGVALQNFSVINSTVSLHATNEMFLGNSSSNAVIAVNNTVDFSLDHVNAFCFSTGRSNSAALALSGFVIGATVRNCALAAQQGIAFLGGFSESNRFPYLFTVGLSIADNFLLCGQRGISFDGMSLHYGNLSITNNLLLGCNNIGIFLNGAALTGSSVVLDKNVFNVSGTAIQSGLDGLHALGNEITATSVPLSGDSVVIPGDGIVIDGGIVESGFVNYLQIVGNRIHGSTGNGIVIRRAVGHGMIKSNIIDGVTGSGLIINGRGAADYLSIENNQFLQIGTNASDFKVNNIYVAIQLTSVQSLDFISNVLDGIGQNSNFNTCIGLLTMFCKDLRIAGNRLQNVSSANSIGIECLTPFQYLAIHDNTVLGADGSNWKALWIWPRIDVNNALEKQINNIRNGSYYVLAIPNKNSNYLFNESNITFFDQEVGSTGIHRNRFTGMGGAEQLVDIANVATCLFTENYCELKANRSFIYLVRIQGRQINASNNRLINSRESSDINDMELFSTVDNSGSESKNIVVLGNLSTNRILVNEQTLSSPWKDLNQTNTQP